MLANNYQCWMLLAAFAVACGLANGSLAADSTRDRPNQFLSPSVKQPAPDTKFDADYPWRENTLTGDWGGLRGELAERGVVFDIRYVSLLVDNTHGGFDTGFFGAGPLGITTTVDTEKLWGHEGGTIFFDWEFNHWYNGRFAPLGTFDPTGSFVGVNTNFMDSDISELNQIAQLYYEQSWNDDAWAAAFGKMDANVRFASVQAAGAFQYSSAMYTPTLNRFIPTYPNEATALVGQWGSGEEFAAKFGWFDGTSAAYDLATGTVGPDTGPRGPRTFFDNHGNYWLVGQVDRAWQVRSVLPGWASAGVWLQTGSVATLGTDTAGVSNVPGCYLQWQQMLWTPSSDLAADGGGVTYFGQFGWSDPNKNPVHWSLMTGMSATGVFPTRLADAVGILFSHAEFTGIAGVYQSVSRDGQLGVAGGQEAAIESFYLWQWTDWSYLQPGVMWIMSPGGGDPAPLADSLSLYWLVGVEF
jgi:porin